MPTPDTQTLWNIPYQRNPFFTGREDVLTQLHRALQADATVALSHPQGISGLGGIGKTQTALEYAYRYGAEYQAVLWVRADSVAALTSSFVELAHVLKLPERDEQDQSIIVEAVQRWFRRQTGWLLVFDNMDDLSLAAPFLPKAGPGHIVFTTRAQSLGGIAQRLDVQKMVSEVGALLLLRRADIIALQALLEIANPDEQSIARAISQELDGLPLALDQAGAYIKEAPCPLPDYLPLYQTRRSNILRERGSFDQDYPASVATTWSLSFEKVSQVNPAAAELLNFCAFLAPDAIPEEIITEGAFRLGPILSPIANDPVQLDLVCGEVLRYSLFQREADVRTLTIHRLVQTVLQDTLEEAEKHTWSKRAFLAVNAAFPHTEHGTWQQCERLLSQALIATKVIERYQTVSEEAGRLLHETASYLHDRARYREARPLYQQALSIREQQLGPFHLDIATSLNNLGILYDDQGEYPEAEALYRRALSIREQQLGKTHHDVAYPLNNLAGLYYQQGKYAEAEPLFQRALRIWEQQSGLEYSNVAHPLNNLANLYGDQGKYTEAEPLYQRALRIWEQQLGPEHPQVASPLNNLANLYREQGKYTEAEPLYQRALRIWEQQLGPEHPQVALALNNLANLYRHQRKYEEAEPLFLQALSIHEQQLREVHPQVAYPLNNLANLYREQGKYAEARSLYQRALHIREQSLGSQHQLTAEVMYDLALFLEVQGNQDEASIWWARALSVYEQAFGGEHYKTIEIRTSFIALLHKMGQHTKATLLEATQSES